MENDGYKAMGARGDSQERGFKERMKEKVVRVLGEEHLLLFMDISGDGG